MDSQEAQQKYAAAAEFFRAGRCDAALKLLEEIAEAFPDHWDVQLARGQCLLHLERWVEAFELFSALQARYGDGPWTKHREVARCWAGDPFYRRYLEMREAGVRTRRRRIWAGASVVLAGALLSVFLLLRPIGLGSEERTPVRPPAEAGNRSTKASAAGPSAADAGEQRADVPAGVKEKSGAVLVAERKPATDSAKDWQDAEAGEEDEFSFPEAMPPGEEEASSWGGAENWDVPTLIRRLRYSPARLEAYAALAYEVPVTLEDMDVIYKALQTDSSDSVRRRLARLLGHIPLRGSVAPLCRSLTHDGSAFVRRNAAWALGRIGGAESQEALVAALCGDPSNSVRKQAICALYELLGPDTYNYFQHLLKIEPNAKMKLTLRWFLDSYYKGTVYPTILPGQATYASHEGTLYKLYVPTSYSPRHPARLVVSVHGTEGSPEAYADMWKKDAEAHGTIVLAPFFDVATFPNYDLLNIDLDADRSDLRLLAMIDGLAQRANIQKERFYLFGHSKGGQFVTRFVLAHPGRIARAAACGSGNYMMPNTTDPFPMGAQPNPFAPDLTNLSFDAIVSTPLAVVIGTKDIERRIEAAKRFMKAAEAYAKKRDIPSRVHFFWVQDGPHLGASNQPAAARFLLGK